MHVEDVKPIIGPGEAMRNVELASGRTDVRERRQHCAYNRTRECILGLEVAQQNIAGASPRHLTAALALKSGEGLWVAPFEGIPATAVPVSVDLIYLDEQCRVIDAVESFLTARAVPQHTRAASLLILPPRTIYSSQTERGDQLVICMPEEMERRLESLSDETGSTTVQDAALLREIPLWSGGPGVLEIERRSGSIVLPGSGAVHEIGLAEPGRRNFKPPRNWLERWWSPDPRKAPREAALGLAAYYWTGAPPAPHKIKDISSTGLYLITEERWYPGTLVLMTLQHSGGEEQVTERTIYVHSRAVRWGSDGVGLQFVVPDADDPLRGREFLVNAVDRKQLDRFLRRLRKRK